MSDDEENSRVPSDRNSQEDIRVPASGSASSNKKISSSRPFRRTYIACIPCRSRKVKCVIGTQPPCAKCEREHRECVFSSEKRSKKRREPPTWARPVTRSSSRQQTPDVARNEAQEAANLRTTSASNSNTSPNQETNQILYDTQGGVQVQRGNRPVGTGGDSYRRPNTRDNNSAIAPSFPAPISTSLQDEHQLHRQQSTALSDQVVRTVVAKSTDTLELLFGAAEVQSNNYSVKPGNSESQNSQPQRPSTDNHASTSNPRPFASPAQNMNGPSGYSPFVTPEYVTHPTPTVSNLSYPAEDVLDLWGKSRFVIQGWFTAQEAITYVDLFFQNMADLSPILPQSYRYHSNHTRLVCEEPMLCTTILMISSRYHNLPGIGGVSRGYHIHQRLWHHCEHLLQRVMLGQEKESTAKTRTIGTIESLLLISEWNPRAILFPPDTDGWDAHLLSHATDPKHRSLVHDQSAPARWREDVFLPAKRSDSMSWMLVGAATSLAYELGIFTEDGIVSESNSDHTSQHPRIRKLLYVYVNQIATRLGCASMLPQNISHLVSGSFSKVPLNTTDQNWSIFMDLWIELTKLMKTALDLLFPSATVTKQILLNGRYITLLQHLAPSLTIWHERFLAQKELPRSFEDILFMEYHHVKAYVNSLAIQAVVERALARGIDKFGSDQDETLYGFIDPQDYNFINEVKMSSRQILQRGTNLVQSGSLKYTPMRALLRITSASMFLLKSISLGGRNIDLQISLKILDESNTALRANPLDDMDLAARYATLIERHTTRFRQNFTSSRQPDLPMGHPQDISGSNFDSIMRASGVDGQMDVSGVNAQYDFTELYDPQTAVGNGLDGWSTQPFDPSLAPFSVNGNQMSLAFDTNSLDFLWNTPLWDGQ